MVTPSTLIANSALPASPDDLWAPAALFLANWGEDIELSSSWATDIKKGLTVSENRKMLVDRPYRALRFTLIATTKDEALLMQDMISRMAHSRFVIPLYCDQTLLTNGSPTNTLNCSTLYRRFYQGARVVIVHRDSNSFEIGTIQSLTSSQIVLTSALTDTFPSDSLVMPLIECRTILKLKKTLITNQKSLLKITLSETTGTSALPAIGASVSEYPSFNFPFSWNSDPDIGTVREGSYSSIGRDSIIQTYGTRAKHTYSIPLNFSTRSDAWDFITFFDHRKGRGVPFWFPSPAREFEYVSHTTADIVVKAIGEEIDWTFRPYIVLLLKNGTYHIRKVASVARAAGNDTVTLGTVLPTLPASDVDGVSKGVLARFNDDELTETWITDEIMSTSVKITELLQEKAVNSSIQPIIPELP